jgi:hemerythrin superfamily protein
MPDVVDLIMNDHREVERIFEELKSSPDKRIGLVPVLVTLLTAHSRAEEAEVYPAARDEAEESQEVEHSQEEHLLADQLLAKLAQTDPESAEFDQVLADLVEGVTHHVEEEERSVLPGMRERLSVERLDQLGEAFAASREQHLGDMPADISKSELKQQADNLDLAGTSGMGKSELKSELSKHADE